MSESECYTKQEIEEMEKRREVYSFKCILHDIQHLTCFNCANCLDNKYRKLLTFIKKEINLREYVCATNHAVLLDNAKELLKEIGEL